jgi:hypothetical protein
MRTFARVAVVGVAGFTVLKLFTTILIPALGMLFGLLALTMKIAVFAAVVYFIWSLVRPARSESDEPSESEMEEKIEIVVEAEPESDGE